MNIIPKKNPKKKPQVNIHILEHSISKSITSISDSENNSRFTLWGPTVTRIFICNQHMESDMNTNEILSMYQTM